MSEETPEAGQAQSGESEETPQAGPAPPQAGLAGTGQLKTNKRTRFHLATGQWIT